MRRAAPGVAIVAAIGVAVSCRDPTEIELDVHTNIAWHDGIDTSFTVGTPGATESASSTTETREPWGADGFVGSLVVVPGAAKDAPLAAKIVMGVTRDPHDCTIAQPDGCIFARRTLSYVPHRALQLPIELYARCIGVPCDASTTCNFLGECVSANVDPSSCDSPTGCAPSGDPPPVDGGVPPPASDAGDASADAPTDASLDGPIPPSQDGGADAGDVDAGPPGDINCPPTMTCLGSIGSHCCLNSGPSGTCGAMGSGCLAPAITVACDGQEDCQNKGQSCCWNGGSTVQCQTLPCASGRLVCHDSRECGTGSTCDSTALAGAYGLCTTPG